MQPFFPFVARLVGEDLALLGLTFGCKAGRAFADQENVRQALHDLPGYPDRMAIALQTADRTAAERAPIHDAGVQLYLAEQVGPATGADAAHRGVHFHRPDAGFDDVQGRPAFLQGFGCCRHADPAL